MTRQITTPFEVRMPLDVKAQVDASSAQLRRSINADIVARLIKSFESADKGLYAFSVGDILEHLIKRLRGAKITVETDRAEGEKA